MKTQQDELYTAEERVAKGRTFTSIDEIQRFVDDLRDNQWWAAQGYWQVARIEVGRPSPKNERRGSVGAWYEDMNAGRIEMAQVHWCQLYILHEVAHVLAAALHGSKSHDPYFARIYLILVACSMGSASYTELLTAFERDGIVHDPGTETESRFAL